MKFLGLEIEKNELKYAVVVRRGKKIFVQEVGQIDNSSSPKVKTLQKKYSHVTTSISSSEIIIRNISFPKATKRALRKAIPMKAETLSVIDPKDLYYSFKTEKKEAETNVAFYLQKKNAFISHLRQWNRLGFDPEKITTAAQALTRFSTFLFKDLSCALLLHIGDIESTLVVMKNNSFSSFYYLDFGSNDLETSKRKFSKHPINEILSAIGNLDGSQNFPLLITGNYHSQFPPILEQSLQGKIAHVIPNKGKLEELKRFAMPIGSCLDALLKDSVAVQLRSSPFWPKKHLKKVGFYSFCLGLLTLTITICMTAFFSRVIEEKKDYLLSRQWKIIQKDNKAMDRKMPVAFTQNFDQNLQSWEKILSKEEKKLPFLHTPKVANALQWISDIPLIDNKNVCLEGFNYELFSYPSIDELYRPYKIRIQLLLQIKDPIHARKLHQYLLTEAKEIDKEAGPLEWDTNGSIYNIRFFLKGVTDALF